MKPKRMIPRTGWVRVLPNGTPVLREVHATEAGAQWDRMSENERTALVVVREVIKKRRKP